MNHRLVIIGGGPSIKGFDFNLLNQQFSFGLNFACHFYNPTALLWVDRDFYPQNKQHIDNKDCIKITKNNCDVPKDFFRLKAVKSYHGLDSLSQGVYTPYLVGLFALTIGVALKFEEIYLLGYDCRFLNNNSHFHDIEHRGKKNEQPYLKGTRHFDVYKDCQSKIFNVSLDSALHVFPKISYSEFCKRLPLYSIQQQTAKEWLKSQLMIHTV
ncbi:MAG: hypothetical protein Q7R33_09670 [Nitrosarchaeum sp.]|nr:hypothetical protein [Nitrosarchaeum sp.]